MKSRCVNLRNGRGQQLKLRLLTILSMTHEIYKDLLFLHFFVLICCCETLLKMSSIKGKQTQGATLSCRDPPWSRRVMLTSWLWSSIWWWKHCITPSKDNRGKRLNVFKFWAAAISCWLVILMPSINHFSHFSKKKCQKLYWDQLLRCENLLIIFVMVLN